MLRRAALVLAVLAACSEDPRYIDPGQALEVGTEASPGPALATVTLPIRLETEDEATERAALAAQLGVQVPYVRRDDLEVSIEWTLRNLDAEIPGTATIDVNGANEMFAFVPAAFVIDPEEDEEPPPLIGGIPMEVGAGEERSGVLREDQVREGSIDLELITRGGFVPERALLEVDEDMTQFASTAGPAVPSEAFAGMVRFDVNFSASTHMVLEYVVRVRDQRGILHEDLLAADPAELVQFAPADYAPPPPPDMM